MPIANSTDAATTAVAGVEKHFEAIIPRPSTILRYPSGIRTRGLDERMPLAKSSDAATAAAAGVEKPVEATERFQAMSESEFRALSESIMSVEVQMGDSDVDVLSRRCASSGSSWRFCLAILDRQNNRATIRAVTVLHRYFVRECITTTTIFSSRPASGCADIEHGLERFCADGPPQSVLLNVDHSWMRCWVELCTQWIKLVNLEPRLPPPEAAPCLDGTVKGNLTRLRQAMGARAGALHLATCMERALTIMALASKTLLYKAMSLRNTTAHAAVAAADEWLARASRAEFPCLAEVPSGDVRGASSNLATNPVLTLRACLPHLEDLWRHAMPQPVAWSIPDLVRRAAAVADFLPDVRSGIIQNVPARAPTLIRGLCTRARPDVCLRILRGLRDAVASIPIAYWIISELMVNFSDCANPLPTRVSLCISLVDTVYGYCQSSMFVDFFPEDCRRWQASISQAPMDGHFDDAFKEDLGPDDAELMLPWM